jgi:hypothetical protein
VSGRIYRVRTRTWCRGRPVSAVGVRGTRSAIVVAGYRTAFEVALGVVSSAGGEDLEDAVKKLRRRARNKADGGE